MIRRHIALGMYGEPKVVTNFLSPQTSRAYCMNNRDTSCGFDPYVHVHVYDYRYGLPHPTSALTL